MRYLVNKRAQENGDHEVHRADDCNRWCLPDVSNRLDLGECISSHEAVRKAKKYFTQTNGCKYCCPESHTS